uniref:Cadherin domain-containing protein n=1 Tax=Macrostomum lignano TaxID=282301 RepID=A0A1I8IJ01_9PLAT
DSETGQLSTGKLLVDFAGHNLSLSLAVSDLGSPPKASLCLVSIRIINHEPNRPVVFGQHHYNVKIVEEAPPGSFVIKVDAKANDMPLVYSITSGNELGLFDIAPSTGVLIVKNPVDRETHGDFFRLGVQVQAVDTRLAVLTEVLVNVLDVNDNRPAFLSDRLSDGVVSEDAQRGQIVREAGRPRPLTIKAADADFGVNQELTYEIADPAADAAFSVDPVTGAIRVSQPLDRETRDLYEFDVWVRDSGTPKRLRSAKPARVRIRILDVNDCPPQYSRADYYTVLELPSYDGARLARIRAYDRDLNNSVSLSIVSGNADGLFQLHPVSGLLTLARPELLREHYYFLVISATDSVHVSLTNISINARELGRGDHLGQIPALPGSAELYRFSLISPSEYFSVNSITGVLATTGRPMDAEQARRHVLLVRATAESKLGFAQVTVQVDDTNDNRPVFVNRPYNTIMFAGQPLGSVALIARAIDADSGANGLVRYELRNHHSEFWINATGGQVYTRKIIEQPAVFTLELRAIDAGSPIQQFSTVAATVQVVANNTPVFPNGSVTVSVSESLRPNSEIFTVQAEAPGSATLIYTIESGNVGEMFSLDFQTGVVKTTDKLDYETIPHYQLTVRVTEPSLKTFTDMQLVINVTDVNDERPEFTASSFDVTVSEHEDPQRKVLLTASATDRDSGAGGEVTYSIEELADGSSDGASFSVDPTSGQLRLSLRLDYETKRQHQFWIVAADRGSPSQSARVPVTIRVADYNDCSPKFRLQTYNVSIAEQSRPGTFVAKVTAVDPDESSELTYSLESSFDAYQFRIDPEYGTIRYQPIQTSLGRTFRLAVLVTDSVHSDRAIVLVNLLPGRPVRPGALSRYSTLKCWRTACPAQVRTIGGAELVYQSFSDKINRLLDIDRRTGRISTRVSLDREGPDPIRTLDFAVLASGSGGLHATCSVVISVLNENDNPPVFDPQPTEIVLAEDAPATVNTTSGLVTLKRSFASYTASMAVDRADLRLHQLTVSARDWEPPYHQTRLDLAVRFAPGPLPEFRLVCSGMASASDDLRLSENSPAGTRLVSCRAQINGSFTSAYQASLAFGESDVRLLIAGDNLTVVSSRPYDRERESAIRFALSARSAGTRPTLPTFRAFRLDILNQPDMPPAFETAEYNLEVSEAAPVGSTLLQARAVDPDGDFPLTYQLLPASGGGGGGGNDSGSASPLRIGQQSGLVTVAAPLDRDSPLATPRAYRLLATDSSGMTGEARLVISLVDVNDEPLTWPTEDASDSTMLSEDAPVDTEVARLSIRDRDDTDRPPVRFYFASRPPAEFDLTEDGRLMLSGQLDRERQDAYEFDILATDGVFTTERAWRQRVLVRDVNDNAPVCRQPLQKLKLSEGLAVGYAVATVVATDADTQEKGLGLLEYFIVYSGNNSAEAAGLFSVDRHSGLVILAAKLDRETADWHSVTVLASDGKFNCSSTLEIQVLDENDCEPEFTAR